MSGESKGRVVAGLGMPHTPGLGNQHDRADPAQLQRILDGFEKGRRQLEAAKPDVIVAFVNDHFDMFTLRNMPGLAIGLGETHWGPPESCEAWIQMKRGPVPGHADLAKDICEAATRDGFELYRMDSAEFIHNVLLPKRFLWPDRDIPVVPIFINCFAPPLPTFQRAYDLGRSVRRVIDRRSERVAVIASGGVSHWPPIVPDAEADAEYNDRIRVFNTFGREAAAGDDTVRGAIMKREIEMSESGRELINVGWDKEILDRLAKGDVSYLTALDHDQVCKDGGPGGAEMLMWVSLMGVMNAAPGDLIFYEDVKPWMGGVSLLSYPDTVSSSPSAP